MFSEFFCLFFPYSQFFSLRKTELNLSLLLLYFLLNFSQYEFENVLKTQPSHNHWASWSVLPLLVGWLFVSVFGQLEAIMDRGRAGRRLLCLGLLTVSVSPVCLFQDGG